MPPATATRTEETPTAKDAPKDDAAAQLAALRRKIRAGQNQEAGLDSSEKAPACRACYQRGWMAALKSLRED